MPQSPLAHHVPHNQATYISFYVALTGPITKPYPQINVSFCVCNNVFISATGTKNSNMFDLNTTKQLLANLKDTPSVLKLNIFLQLQAIIHDHFLNLSEKFLDMSHIAYVCKIELEKQNLLLNFNTCF